jgi:hypothetical protein
MQLAKKLLNGSTRQSTGVKRDVTLEWAGNLIPF